MRKDKFAFDRISLFTVYKIRGKNLLPLLNYCKRRGVTLFNVLKKDEKTTEFSVKYGDNKKFFAIIKELCYNNITKVKEGGIFYPFLYLLRSFGLVFGAVVFIAIAMLSTDLIYSIEYSGGASASGVKITEYLSSIGIKEFSFFSSFDIEKTEDLIVLNNEGLSFAGVKKDGNVLKIRLEPAKSEVKTVKKREKLFSDEDGTIESIKVYSGTAVKSVGDAVKKGDLLVDGYAVIKENLVKTEVVAIVSIIVTKEFTYRSESDDREKLAETLAVEELDGVEPVEITTEKTFTGGEYVYKTKVKIRHVI